MKKFVWKRIEPGEFQSFVDDYEGEKTFLQSQKYGRFREKVKESIFYIGIFSQPSQAEKSAEKSFGRHSAGKIVAVALIQKVSTKLRTFLHCPHGPLVGENSGELMEFFLAEYKKCGKAEACDFVRISPLWSENSAEKLTKAGYKSSAVHLVNPELTWVLDLSKPEEELLAEMKKSTRYEVRRIEKVGITVKQGSAKADLDIFWDLHLQTVSRQGFRPFPRRMTEIEMECFGNDFQIFSAEIDHKYYSSSIILFDKRSAYYHQGSSIYSKLPVAHATLWAAILEAKKRDCQTFNFWGVCEADQTKHPWYGLSKFKRGFGGSEQNFAHCHEAPLTWKYHLSRLVDWYRKWKRNY